LCSEAIVAVEVGAAESPTSPSASPSPGTGGVAGPTETTSDNSSLGSLAGTGGPAIGLLFGGLIAVLLGAGLVLTQRRRSATQPR